jgi:glycosyltransferase involved in cell wall biosynthesis
MHILVTADTVGGVWTYARELVTGLLARGVRVTLVSFGGLPSAAQTRWMEPLRGLDYRPTAFKLEWMQESASDMEASSEFLRDVIRETSPDIVHFNQFYYGALKCDIPCVVVAHSDVVSWWVAVHQEEPPPSSWLSWYRDVVTRGLAGATVVIAPSRWMLDQVERCYVKRKRCAVIYNGRTPALFNPSLTKEATIVTAGRLWDAGKNAKLLLAADMPAPVQLVGARWRQETQTGEFSAHETKPGVQFHPPQDEEQMAEIFARAAIYAAPSRYEPFGLTPLEAALSRCALVASNIPTFRELWDGAAFFFPSNDAKELRQALELLVHDPRLRQQYASLAYEHAVTAFQATHMTDGYMELYQALAPASAAAA